jgi:hypothetical protein
LGLGKGDVGEKEEKEREEKEKEKERGKSPLVVRLPRPYQRLHDPPPDRSAALFVKITNNQWGDKHAALVALSVCAAMERGLVVYTVGGDGSLSR